MYSCARYVNRPYSIAAGGAWHPDVLSILRSKTLFEPQDVNSASLYRRAYGEAARLVEIARFDHCFGRDFAAGIGSRIRPSCPKSGDGWARRPIPSWSGSPSKTPWRVEIQSGEHEWLGKLTERTGPSRR